MKDIWTLLPAQMCSARFFGSKRLFVSARFSASSRLLFGSLAAFGFERKWSNICNCGKRFGYHSAAIVWGYGIIHGIYKLILDIFTTRNEYIYFIYGSIQGRRRQ